MSWWTDLRDTIIKPVATIAAVATLGPAVGSYLLAGTVSATAAAAIGSGLVAGAATAVQGGSVSDVLKSAITSGLLTSAGQAIQIPGGSMTVAGAVKALQGGSFVDVVKAAATAGVVSSLGSDLANFVAPYVNIVNTNVTQQQLEDAKFAAEDAKQLAAQGLSKTQIKNNLISAGVNTNLADIAATDALAGVNVAKSAVTLANSTARYGDVFTANQAAIATANKAIVIDNFKPSLDVSTGTTAGDAEFMLADAKQLAAQGLSADQIKSTLTAAGADPSAVNLMNKLMASGWSDDKIINQIKTNLGDKQLYGSTPEPAATPGTPGVTPGTTPTAPTAPTAPVVPTNVAPHYATNLAADIDFAIADAQQLKAQGLNANQINQVLQSSGLNVTAANYLASEISRGTPSSYLKTDLNSFGRDSGLYGKAPAPAPTTPSVPVKLPDGTVGTYDPATGDVHDAGGTKIVSGTEPTPGSGTDVAGPYRVDITGQPATDLMTAAERAQYLKGPIPDGTVIANSDTPNAYYDIASNAWVVKSGPTEITQPVEPVEIPQDTTKVTPVDVTPVAPVTPTEPPPATTPGSPGNIVAPPGTEIVYDELGNTYFFNNTTGEILDSTGKVIYTPPPETPVPPPGTTPTPTPTEPPVTPPPASYVPPTSYVPITGDDGKDYYFDPDTGVVVDTDGKTVYTPPTTPTPPTTEPPVVTPPVGPVTPGEPPVVQPPVGPVTPGEPPVVQPPVEPPVVQPPVTPPPVEPPLTPLPPVEIPPTPPVPPVVVPPPVEPPPVEPPIIDPEPPVTPVPPNVPIPPIPPDVITPTPTPTPTTKVWDPVSVSFKTLPLLPNPGLNPGFIQAQPQYQTTSPVQSQYYWGQRPYQSGGEDRMTFDPALYKQVSAPVQPWGLQELYTPTNIAQYLAQLQGPVKP